MPITDRPRGKTRSRPWASPSETFGPGRPIFAYHIDQPSNDFNSLFTVLDADADSYARHDANVFPCAIGRSFYSQVLPSEYVHLGWSSYAAVWLSRVPSLIPGHFIALRSRGTVRAAFAAQAARDWEEFLTLRAVELRPGGRLVVVLPALDEAGSSGPALDEAGSSGFEGLMDHANAVLAEMVQEGLLRAEERARMVLRSYPRRNSELLAPFAAGGQFQQLLVEDCAFSVLEDAVWAAYQQDGDQEALAAKQALFFRSIFVPSLASALGGDGDAASRRAFGQQVEQRLRQQLARHPAAMHSFVGIIVLAKQRAA